MDRSINVKSVGVDLDYKSI